MSSPNDGIYAKYRVTRTDGSSEPGRKHANCTYFVLDLEHDPHAIPALRAYAESCRDTYPELASDIDDIVSAEAPDCNCREAACPHARTFGPENASEMASLLMARGR